MNDGDHGLFEAELLKLAPARPPAELMAKLAAARPHARPQPSGVPTGFGLRQSSGASGWGRGDGKRQRTGAVQDAAAPTRSAPLPVSQLSTLNSQLTWRLLLRWLAPTAAVAAAVALLVWWPSRHDQRQNGNQGSAAAQPALRADNVEFDQKLVAAFDAVARLPSGQPVRFRCREWADAVVLHDSASGIVVEQRTPRLEVVPVSFETY
jgi:hypothetical protein